MNKYPYPVLLESDSDYRDDIKFEIIYQKSECVADKLRIELSSYLSSMFLQTLVSKGDAKVIIRLQSSLYIASYDVDVSGTKIIIEVPTQYIAANDTIYLTSYILTKNAILLMWNDEIKNYYEEEYSIELRANDVLAVSNTESLDYRTNNNDFIKFKVADEQSGKGIVIRLTDENYIDVLVSKEFNYAYGVLKKNELLSPVLGSHIVFETFVYALVNIAQDMETYKEKDWFKSFDQMFSVLGESIEDFVNQVVDEYRIDMDQIFCMAQRLINNQIENSLILVSEREVR